MAKISKAKADREERIAELEAENADLKKQLATAKRNAK